MQWNEVPADTRQHLLVKYESGTLTDDDALALGLHPENLKRRLRGFRQGQQLAQLAGKQTLHFPTQSRRRYDDFMIVESEEGIFISDIHIPNGDTVWLETVLLTAIRHNVRTLFILGDALDSNQPGISTWLSTWAQPAPSFPEALGMFKALLRIFLIWFDAIYLCTGNHDQRIAKVTGGQIDLGTFLSEFDCRVQFTNYRKLYVTNHRGYLVCYHQANFSSNGVALGRKMYNQENFRAAKPYALITTHIHQWSCGKSEDNLCAVYSLGASEDDTLSQYANETPSTHARRSQSLIIMKRGYLRNLERFETDWRQELGSLAAKASICA